MQLVSSLQKRLFLMPSKYVAIYNPKFLNRYLNLKAKLDVCSFSFETVMSLELRS